MSLHVDNETIKALAGLPVSLLTKTEHVTETSVFLLLLYYIAAFPSINSNTEQLRRRHAILLKGVSSLKVRVVHS